MEKKYLIMLIIGLVVISAILYGCANQKWKIDPEIKKILDKCDEDQKIIDMAIIPECYLFTFKEHGWSETKVREYIQYRLKINIDEMIKEDGAWQDAWIKYYSNKEFTSSGDGVWLTKTCEGLPACQVSCYDESVDFYYNCRSKGKIYSFKYEDEWISVLCPEKGNSFSIEDRKCKEEFII